MQSFDDPVKIEALVMALHLLEQKTPMVDARTKAEDLLLEYIGSKEVLEAFNAIRKWSDWKPWDSQEVTTELKSYDGHLGAARE